MSESLAVRITNAYMRHSVLEEEVFDFARAMFATDENDYPFKDVWCDPSDWVGISLELKGTKRLLVPTEAQLEEAYAKGFDVIDIEDPAATTYKRYHPAATIRRQQEITAKYHPVPGAKEARE